MDWLTGNWIWVFVVVAGLWFFMRRGGLHGRSMGGRHGRSQGNTREGHDGATQPAPSGDAPTVAGAALDPVSGNPVRTDRALTAVFGGRAYYFESDDTRQRFEAEPQKYAGAAAPLVQADRPRRRRGC
ncbi:YHS domain-containing protein [Azospira restricta]|uniref:YHS domain-containing protein n=1 Tax=Azospira restricta TaxID=404405 RepID=A0A974SQJ7_9RHOO|nr:YHS domain-containing protein [Azospira restricta]QRJ64616.1 YHS domain-containing protein [Azospira restricta]